MSDQAIPVIYREMIFGRNANETFTGGSGGAGGCDTFREIGGRVILAGARWEHTENFEVGGNDLIDMEMNILPTILNKGGSGCTDANPCGICEGDCDNDNHCAGNLKCHDRTNGGPDTPGLRTSFIYFATHQIDTIENRYKRTSQSVFSSSHGVDKLATRVFFDFVSGV